MDMRLERNDTAKKMQKIGENLTLSEHLVKFLLMPLSVFVHFISSSDSGSGFHAVNTSEPDGI